jgi:hypothetical protein
MPIWGWVFIAAIVVVAVAGLIVAISAARRRRTDRLKEQFGPEYERTVAEAGEPEGGRKRARRARTQERQARHSSADTGCAKGLRGPLAVQTAFVDSPASAVGDADRLVTEVMRERGYPIDDFDQRAADISVDHPTVVENYRAAHTIHVSQQSGDVGTEKQRQAFVHYRALFEKLLNDDGRPQDTDTAQEASA